MKILFVTIGTEIMASSRTRVYQYLPYLDRAGIQYHIIPKKGNSVIRHLRIILLAGSCDIIFIQKVLFREWFQNLLKLLNKNIVFDFDDAIYTSVKVDSTRDTIRKNLLIHILRISKYIIVENVYTKEFAVPFNRNILVITGPIDRKRYFPASKTDNKNIVIGRIGNSENTPYVESLFNIFRKISMKYPEVVFEFIGADVGAIHELPLHNCKIKKWALDTEVKDLQNFDIGIMPLPDNEWTRGKGGYKLLQYMAVGIPCIASPVGINRELISEGVNGFLASSENEWEEKLSILIENREMRLSMGSEGRKKAVNKYSFDTAFPVILDCFLNVSKIAHRWGKR